MVNITVISSSATKRERWVLAAVISLCLLVLVFSFAAKLSLYQPHPVQLMNLSAAKMWWGGAESAIVAITCLQQAAALLFLTVALRIAISLTKLYEQRFIETPTLPWFDEYFSNHSLRAPPIF